MNVGNGLDRSADNHRTYYPNVGRGRAPAANNLRTQINAL